MSNSKIDLEIDFLSKNQLIRFIAKKQLQRKRNELIQEEAASIVMSSMDDFKVSLSDLSEVKILLTKNGTNKKSVVTIDSTVINSFKGYEEVRKFINDLLYIPIRSLNFKPTVKI